MIEPPLDWERNAGEIHGGFHTPELRRAAPFIKTKGEEHAEYVASAYPFKHIQAVNAMQRTPWKNNTKVFDFLQEALRRNWQLNDMPRKDRIEVPPHPGEDADEETILQWKRDAKRVHGRNKQNACELVVLGQSLQMAEALRDREFWYSYTCDFRGRIYCTSTTLNPQGPDHIRGLLTFSRGKPLGREGIRWLAINGANKYGYDKVDHNDRVRWVLGQRDAIAAFVQEPLSSESRSFIGGADKPFQFAAFCYEWMAAATAFNISAPCFVTTEEATVLTSPRAKSRRTFMERSPQSLDDFSKSAVETHWQSAYSHCTPTGVPLSVQ
jgi:DNA-directed RNA polymerase